MKLYWNDRTLEEWEKLFRAVPRSNLLQSWPYAQMMRAVNQMSTRFGRLAEGDETVAIFQVHEVRLAGLYHAVTLDRGPLWLKKQVTQADWGEFVDLFTAEFPKRFGRRRRFMPEISEDSAGMLPQAGFRARAPGYQSIWIDLSREEADLRQQLKQKWRNALNQADKKNLTVEEQNDPLTFNWLMRQYEQDQLEKSYQGPSVKVLKSLYEFCHPRGEVMLLTAQENQDAVAAILLLKHGQGATYQVGWTSNEGRERRAHQLLLWQAILMLNKDGISWLDLGGIHPEKAAGVTKFKRGLNGQEFQLAGVYA